MSDLSPPDNSALSFRHWAAAHGYLQEREADGTWGVPLHGGKGWLWDAAENVGVHLTAPTVAKPGCRTLAKMAGLLKATSGWREQTLAGDALLGWVSRKDWDKHPEAYEGLFFPKREAGGPASRKAPGTGAISSPRSAAPRARTRRVAPGSTSGLSPKVDA